MQRDMKRIHRDGFPSHSVLYEHERYYTATCNIHEPLYRDLGWHQIPDGVPDCKRCENALNRKREIEELKEIKLIDFKQLRLKCPSFVIEPFHRAPRCAAKAHQDKHNTWLDPCHDEEKCPFLYWAKILRQIR